LCKYYGFFIQTTGVNFQIINNLIARIAHD
jgi:hypothetical protein